MVMMVEALVALLRDYGFPIVLAAVALAVVLRSEFTWRYPRR